MNEAEEVKVDAGADAAQDIGQESQASEAQDTHVVELVNREISSF